MSKYWWVNQGATYEQERSGGYVWAPTKTKAGHPVAHHVNVGALKPGDTLIHYADGAIRAVGSIRENAGVQKKPIELPGNWGDEGYVAKVEYHELNTPIPLADVPGRTTDAGPFNRVGGVNQGYLYPLSQSFAEVLYQAFQQQWPIGWFREPQAPSVWLFQANPNQWNVEVEVPKLGVGTEDTWTATRFRDQMKPGDPVVIWQSGPRAGVYALAEITGAPQLRHRPQFRPPAADGSDEEWAIPLRYTRYLSKPILRTELMSHPILREMSVIRAPQGTNYRLTEQEWSALKGLLGMGWDEFIFWAKKLKEWPDFDAHERDYKVQLANRLKTARDLFRSGDDQWIEALRKALTSKENNFTNWRIHNPFLGRIDESPAEASAVLRHLWEDPTSVGDAIEKFALALSLPGAGKSSLVTLASVLLGAVDMLAMPPYRKRAYFKGYDLTGYAHPSDDATRGEVYVHALTFLDRIVTEAASRGLVLRDRLDAQSVLWTISQGNEVEDWSEAEKARFRAFATGTAPNPVEEDEDDDLEVLARKLHLDVDYLHRVRRLLEHKQQVVFYGPPGTGKTYVAKKLAEVFAASGGVVEKVQFHPSYAYEDFVEGYRPRLSNGQAAFALVAGPLRRIAEQAQKTDSVCVLLIDEINRGNVAKIFGEPYYLLEYRNEQIALQYSEQPFLMPKNLWIIGTMNTADRSIALVDAALRRRFHFVPFYPDRAPVQGLLRRWLQTEKPQLLWVADVVDRANELLGNNHMAIGPSHFLRPDLTEEWVELIWEHSVLPYIAEQYFGDDARLEAFALSKLRQPKTAALPESE